MLPTALLSLVCVPLLLFVFPETLPGNTTNTGMSYPDSETKPLLTNPNPLSAYVEGTGAHAREERTRPYRCCRLYCESRSNLPSACKVLAIPDVVLCTVTYACTLFVVVAFNNMLDLWAAATPDAGGLGWTTNITGSFEALIGLCSVVWSFGLYPLTIAQWRLHDQLRLGQTILPFALVIFPFASRFQSSEGGFGDWRLWGPLMLMALSVQIPMSVCSVAGNSMANNSVSAQQRVCDALPFV